jgi:hypothetical protein
MAGRRESSRGSRDPGGSPSLASRYRASADVRGRGPSSRDRAERGRDDHLLRSRSPYSYGRRDDAARASRSTSGRYRERLPFKSASGAGKVTLGQSSAGTDGPRGTRSTSVGYCSVRPRARELLLVRVALVTRKTTCSSVSLVDNLRSPARGLARASDTRSWHARRRGLGARACRTTVHTRSLGSGWLPLTEPRKAQQLALRALRVADRFTLDPRRGRLHLSTPCSGHNRAPRSARSTRGRTSCGTRHRLMTRTDASASIASSRLVQESVRSGARGVTRRPVGAYCPPLGGSMERRAPARR